MPDYSNRSFGATIDTAEITDLAITAAKIANATITVGKLATSASNALSSPIGSVVAWLKNYPNTPAIPAGWIECNGEVIVDALSVYNGQATPNLNGDGTAINYFLRGATTSGTTGGADSHSHPVTKPGSEAGGSGGTGYTGQTAATASTVTTLPTYYQVVWIMRFK